jgi:hypothetical protein
MDCASGGSSVAVGVTASMVSEGSSEKEGTEDGEIGDYNA